MSRIRLLKVETRTVSLTDRFTASSIPLSGSTSGAPCRNFTTLTRPDSSREVPTQLVCREICMPSDVELDEVQCMFTIKHLHNEVRISTEANLLQAFCAAVVWIASANFCRVISSDMTCHCRHFEFRHHRIVEVKEVFRRNVGFEAWSVRPIQRLAVQVDKLHQRLPEKMVRPAKRTALLLQVRQIVGNVWDVSCAGGVQWMLSSGRAPVAQPTSRRKRLYDHPISNSYFEVFSSFIFFN